MTSPIERAKVLRRRVLKKFPEMFRTDHPKVLADLDAPKERELDRIDQLVGGWVIDEDAPIRRVELLINGVVIEVLKTEASRPDISEVFPSYDTKRPGWSTWVDFGKVRGDRLRLQAIGIRHDGARVTLHDGRYKLHAKSAAPTRSARWVSGHDLAVGYQRIYGMAHCPGGVARVDVHANGVPIGTARVALPSNVVEPLAPEDHMCVFEIVHDFAAGTIELDARITGCDGVSFDLAGQEFRAIDGGTADENEPTTSRGQGELDEGPRTVAFTHSLALGGGQLYLQELLLRLGRRGHRFLVVAPEDGVLRAELEEHGHEVHISGEWPLASERGYEGRLAELVNWLASKNCTAAIGNTLLAFPGMDAAQRLGISTTWAIHESFDLGQFWMEAFAPGSVCTHAQDRAAAALAGAGELVFEAAATMEQYREHTQGSAAVVPYGVDAFGIDEYRAENDRADVRARLGIAEDETLLLCMGTVEPRKAQLMLAQAFHGIDAPSARLVFVGARPGVYVDTITAYLEDSAEKRVRIEAITPDTYDWYFACDVLVCASDVESLPRSILEAMLFERPVASTAVFGIPELIEDGVHGWLCQPRDVRALESCLKRAITSDPADSAVMGRRAAELVRLRHAPDIYVDFFERRLSGVVVAEH